MNKNQENYYVSKAKIHEVDGKMIDLLKFVNTLKTTNLGLDNSGNVQSFCDQTEKIEDALIELIYLIKRV